MALLNMRKILEDMGWSDGYHIPVANKENLALEKEVERLTIAKAKASLALDAISSKCSALDDHVKYVKTEQQENQNIISAHQSQLETERNMFIASKIEKDRLVSEIKNLSKENEIAETRKQGKLTNLNDLMTKFTKLKMAIEWDEQTIDDWEQILLRKNEDNDIIKKYSKEDTKRALELEIKRQHLQEEEQSRRQLVIRTATENDNMDLILTRTNQIYKQIHDDRQTLVKQWQDAIGQLQQRDHDTMNLSREILNTREVNETKLELLEQEKDFYKNEVNNNKELELQIEQENLELSRMRKEYNNYYTLIQNYTVEHQSMKKELKKTSALVQIERMSIKKLNKEILQKEKSVQKEIVHLEVLKQKEKDVTDSNMTASDRTRELENIIDIEECTAKGLLSDMENLQVVTYRTQQSLNELIETYKIIILDVRNHEQGYSLLVKKKQQVINDIAIQKEHIYKLDFAVTMMESKIHLMTGFRSDEMSKENEQKMKELEKTCTEVIDLSRMLHTQVTKLDDVMRSISNHINADTDRLVKMKNNLQEQILLVEGGRKQVAVKRNMGHQRQVEENILRVKLKHCERSLKQEGVTVFNLQRQQVELETMMQEREAEIQMNKEILSVKKNSILEEKNRLRNDISYRLMKMEQLKIRNDMVLATMGRTDSGEQVSVAYFKVKNAQEKYELQEEGDKLDKEIRKTEHEILAMENTLKAVNSTNETFKKSLAIVEEHDDELAKTKELEVQIYTLNKEIRHNRNKLNEQLAKLQDIKGNVDVWDSKIGELEGQITELIKERDTLSNESEYRYSKIARAQKQIDKVYKQKDIDQYAEKDFVTVQLQETNKSAKQQLSEIVVRYMEIKPTLTRYLTERNITLNVGKPKTRSRVCSLPSQTTSRSSGSSILSVNLTFDL